MIIKSLFDLGEKIAVTDDNGQIELKGIVTKILAEGNGTISYEISRVEEGQLKTFWPSIFMMRKIERVSS